MVLPLTWIYKIQPKIRNIGHLSLSIVNYLHTLIVNDNGGVLLMSEAVGGYGGGFALIVVLFILLIIVGASYVGYGY